MNSSNQLRLKVLLAFKELHKARLQVFRGDKRSSELARLEINKNFRQNLHNTDPKKIEELIVVAQDSADILKKHVVQLEELKDNHFRVNLTKDTYTFDNKVYKDIPEKELLKRKKNCHSNCSDKDKK